MGIRGQETDLPVRLTKADVFGRERRQERDVLRRTVARLHGALVTGHRADGVRDGYGLNPRTLAERLKMLERDGVVVRRAFAEVPPRVEYSLTPRGCSLASVLEAMGEWGTRDLRDRASHT